MLATLFTCFYYPECMGSGIEAINKATEILSVMIVCRRGLHNGVMEYICLKLVKISSTEFL